MFCGIAIAQSSTPTENTRVASGPSVDLASSSIANDSDSEQRRQQGATQSAAKPGNVMGTVLDQAGTVGTGAIVRLTTDDKSFSKEVVAGNTGQFSFSNVSPGSFKISVSAEGFGNQEFAGELALGQTFLVPAIVISIAIVVTAVDVKVSVDPVEVAIEEIKIQE